MKLKIIRRLFLIRLALSFVLDYWKIRRLNKQLHGNQLEKALDDVYAKAGKRMRNTAFRLKGIIVKVGQFLSMRQDILPRVFIKELADLQDSLPAAPFCAIKPLIEQELQCDWKQVFKMIDENAVAAASLAQVHKAILHDGSKVAVKIFRPQMEQLAQADLDTLGLIAKVAQRFRSLSSKMNFIELHREFTETIQKELDCKQELLHLQKFKNMFTNDSRITIPKAHEEYTTHRLLVMEYVEGARVTDQILLDKWNIDTKSIATTLLESYLRQILVFGFIHVDPHPGNLLILSDHRICFLDFGMVDILSAKEVLALRKLLQSIMMHDPDGILTVLSELGFLRNSLDQDEKIKPIINQLLDQLSMSKQTPPLTTVVDGLRAFMRDSSIQLQAKYMFLIRCIGILAPSLSILAPNTDWSELLMEIGPSVIMSPVKARND